MKSERSRNNHAMHRATGAVSNRGPWGVVITGGKHAKQFAPTDEARELVPEVIRRAIAGEPTLAIARSYGWNDKLAGRIIGRGSFWASLGVISHSDAQAALAAVRSRRRGGGRPGADPALLVPRCPCGGKMYRIFNNGAGGARVPYYRCWQQCGRPSVLAADLDAVVTEAMTGDTSPHMTRVWVAGTGAADEAAKLRAEAMKAYAGGDKAKFLELDSQADALDSQPEIRARWSLRMSCGCESLNVAHVTEAHDYETEGDYFGRLEHSERRAYLRSWVVTSEVVDGEAGAVIMPRELA